MDPIRIDDPDDPRIAAYRDIRERDLVGRHGLFVAEGKVVLDVLFAANRFAPQSVLLLENRLAGMAQILASAPAHLPVYVADSGVLDRIAGFHLHRGILAIGERLPAARLDDELHRLPATARLVVLVGIANHDNVGAIFRNAAAFGADAVVLDATCCDPLYRKAIRVSVGAVLKVPFVVVDDVAELIAALDAHGFVQMALSPGGATEIRSVKPSARIAFYLGAEGTGLPSSILGQLNAVRIEMAPGFDSLNVAAAAAIALHALAPPR